LRLYPLVFFRINLKKIQEGLLVQLKKKEALARQKYKCARCREELDPRATHFHHKVSWASGGRTITKNEVALCSKCHDIITHAERLKIVDKKRKTRNVIPSFL
jgi:5-methylcytosine-specific restriction endonuclease McrA